MENDHQKFCCIVPLTLKHILVECPSFTEERTRYYGQGQQPIELGDILVEQPMKKFDLTKLVNFVQEIDIVNKI